jgi:hypothetical protein
MEAGTLLETAMDHHMTWDSIPAHVRSDIEQRIGGVCQIKSIPAAHGEFAALVYGELDELFVKAIPMGSEDAYLHKYERWAARHLPASVPAPAVVWETEVATSAGPRWYVTGWEPINDYARRVDLQQNSADVPIVLETVAELGKLLTPCPPGTRTIVQRLNPIVAKAKVVLNLPGNGLYDHKLFDRALHGFVIDRLHGDTMLHANLGDRSMLIKDHAISVVGWSRVCSGQPWIEAALFAPYLALGGHRPEEIYSLLWTQSAWRNAPADQMAGLTALWTLYHHHQGHLAKERDEASVRLAEAGRKWLGHLVAQT